MEMRSIVCMNIIIKKYTFDALLNCKNRLMGMNVIGVYLLVLILLLPYLAFADLLLESVYDKCTVRFTGYKFK